MAGNLAARRYTWRVGVAMAIYLGSMVAANYLIGRDLVSGPLIWPLALIPGLAVSGVFYAVAMFLVEQKDEFLRVLMVRQTLVATGFALTVATIWGFLESFELVPHVDAYWVAILWFAGLGLGALVNRLTLGTAGMQCP